MITRDQLLNLLKNHNGANNGLHMRELASRLYGAGAGDYEERKIRSLIVCLRDEGHPICSRPDTGYFIAATQQELDATCDFLLRRVQTTVTQIARMKRRSVPNLRGQLGLPPAALTPDQTPAQSGETP